MQVDYFTAQVSRGRPPDPVFRRTVPVRDEEEIVEIVARSRRRGLPQLVELAEKRGTRRQPVGAGRAYRRGRTGHVLSRTAHLLRTGRPMSHELEVGQVLDGRFHISM